MSACDKNSHPLGDKWVLPTEKKRKHLQVYNSLTRTKVPFNTTTANTVKWYNCGPTVYDASHIGHARNYVTFDIIRRILENHFGYNVNITMNITDVDDKIIIRARHAYLMELFRKEHPTVTESTLKICHSALDWFVKEKFDCKVTEVDQIKADDEKKVLHLKQVKDAISIFSSNPSSIETVVSGCQDILSSYLDSLKGSKVNDPKIFRQLAQKWETDFLEDMESLNVRPVTMMTRVSEFIPEIINYIQKIIKNGFAYAVDGSVYFNVPAYSESLNHTYAKLCPWAAGCEKLAAEGEGLLGAKLSGKRDSRDFALWKCSKPGEPIWSSPWGEGRPGWHIECSAMAEAASPGILDIHSGGIDLDFPHHDNEIAQSEAFSNSDNWVNYFLHTGHVHIEGSKMSKSLKNFITIKAALQKHSPNRIRMLFLQHHWNHPLNYKESAMEGAASVDNLLSNFLSTINALTRNTTKVAPSCPLTGQENNLMGELIKIQDLVDQYLADNFDTPSVILQLQDLVSKTNIYISQSQNDANKYVLLMVASYMNRILSMFGLEYSQNTSASIKRDTDKETLIKSMEIVSNYRDAVRTLILSQSNPLDLLDLSDKLRDQLFDLGICIEDRTGQSSLVKLIDLDQVEKKKQEDSTVLTLKEAEIAKMKQIKAKRMEEKLSRSSVDPLLMFKDISLYSKFDDQGIPTHLSDGALVTKSARKKLVKEQEKQSKLFEKFTKSNQ